MSTPPDAQPANPSSSILPKLLLALIVVALIWRLGLALYLPIISRDGAQFCWYAQGLDAHGLSYLRSEQAQQHPLYPALILMVHSGMRLVLGEQPIVWQGAGQLVSWLSGLAVVWLMMRVTTLIVQQLGLAQAARTVGLVAGVLTAWLPLHVHLSVDVLSDELHLALYLLGIDQMLRLRDWPAAIGVGFAAGLAFLVRPEGGAIALGAGSTLLCLRGVLGWRGLLLRGMLVGVSLLLCIAPYWYLTGALTHKKNPLPWMVGEEVARCELTPDSAAPESLASGDPAYAKLETVTLPAVSIPFSVAYQTGRAGRVVLPLLGLIGLWRLRKFLLGPVLVGPLTCAGIHFSLLMVLQSAYHYLAPRHTLVLIALLTPAAALVLIEIMQRLSVNRAAQAGVLLVLAWPLVWYNLRLPNGADAYIRDLGRYLGMEYIPNITQQRLMSGSGLQRVAFYTGATPVHWHENDQLTGERIATQMLGERADYFLIETGPGFERAGNAERIAQLQQAPALADRLTLVAEFEPTPGVELHVFRLAWPSE